MAPPGSRKVPIQCSHRWPWLNRSQNQTKNHESGKKNRKKEGVGDVGRDGEKKRRGGGSYQNALHICIKCSKNKLNNGIFKRMLVVTRNRNTFQSLCSHCMSLLVVLCINTQASSYFSISTWASGSLGKNLQRLSSSFRLSLSISGNHQQWFIGILNRNQ